MQLMPEAWWDSVGSQPRVLILYLSGGESTPNQRPSGFLISHNHIVKELPHLSAGPLASLPSWEAPEPDPGHTTSIRMHPRTSVGR